LLNVFGQIATFWEIYKNLKKGAMPLPLHRNCNQHNGKTQKNERINVSK